MSVRLWGRAKAGLRKRPQIRRDPKRAPAEMAEETCAECKAKLVFICNIDPGTDTGYGRADLYQCRGCKTVVVK